MRTPVDRPVYLEHFGLERQPFQLTPNTDFFFQGSSRGDLLAALGYAICHGDGIITVTGEVGTGKTMLARMLIETAPHDLKFVYIANPSINRDEILAVIGEELGLKVAVVRVTTLLRRIQKRLVQLHAQGRRVVVIVDEAHAMPAGTLEEIRLLSNLETNTHKLLQMVLFGQQELNELLAGESLRPLRERVTQRFEVPRLGAGEIGAYLAFRLERAGGDRELFEPRAVALMARAADGLARRVNILAEKGLLAAFVDGTSRVQAEHLRAAVDDAAFRALRPRPGILARLARLFRFRSGSAVATARTA
ncbi:MAG: AAA family ATPase [Burkholderiaceae bacterium]